MIDWLSNGFPRSLAEPRNEILEAQPLLLTAKVAAHSYAFPGSSLGTRLKEDQQE